MAMDEKSASDARQLLNGWKQIAVFFQKDERTVRRWARSLELPVHRVAGAKRATIYAYSDELEQWLKNHRSELNGSAPSEPNEVSGDRTMAPTGEAVAVPARPWLAAGAATLAALVGLTIWTFGYGGSGKVFTPASRQPAQQITDLYLNGIYLSQKRTPEGLSEAIKVFETATSLDPNYAPAYAELAAAYELSVDYKLGPTAESYQRAALAAKKAIELDPSLAQAHAVLADVDYYWLRRYDQAFARFEEAVRLDPRSAQIRQWHAEALLYSGRCREALVQADKAQQLDPKSRSILAAKAHVLLCMGDIAQADALFRQLAANEPDYPLSYLYLAFIALERNDFGAYFGWMEKIATAVDDAATQAIIAAGRDGLAKGGREAMVDAMIDTARAPYDKGEIPAYYMAHFAALKNDAAAAAGYLKICLDRLEDDAFEYSIDPAFKQVRANPVFTARIAELGLPVVPSAMR